MVCNICGLYLHTVCLDNDGGLGYGLCMFTCHVLGYMSWLFMSRVLGYECLVWSRVVGCDIRDAFGYRWWFAIRTACICVSCV